MNMEAVKQTFLVESRGLLESMEHALLDLEKDYKDEENLNAIFRAAHTVKGSAGMFGYSAIVEFTHVLENFLEKVRKGEFELNDEWSGVLLGCHDHILALVELHAENDNPEVPAELKEKGDALLEKINDGIKASSASSASENSGAADSTNDNRAEGSSSVASSKEATEKQETEEQATETPSAKEHVDAVKNEYWHISLHPRKDVFRHGLDPLSFINYLEEIGSIKELVTIVDFVPDIEELESESSYLGFEINFQSEKDYETIEQVFDFLLDDCFLSIQSPHASLQNYVDMIATSPLSRERLLETLIGMNVLTQEEIEALNTIKEEQKKEDTDMLETDTVALATDTVSTQKQEQKEPQAILKKEVNTLEKTGESVPVKKPENGTDASRFQNIVQRYIRIDANKLDTLINQVGELVITSANVRQLAEQSNNKNLVEATSIMNRLVEDVRDISMNIRMVQIGETFRKFERVVHDLSREMSKKIHLRILGGETELDKTVVEKISDPLIHLIRNAADHGIDSSEKRKAKGKPEEGFITLNAYHDTGNIVIEVSDDGEGLNKEKILKKAIDSGLVEENQALSEKEIFNLVFKAGFSTADKITNVSGRGVGMDVVMRNVESLRGSVDIESEEGKGTTVRIHLPLTLAIIDGFLVRVGKAAYVLPLDMVLECIDMSSEHRIRREGGNFINLRGEVLPFLDLRNFFKLEDGEDVDESSQSIIVVNYAKQKAGLVVDELFGEFQTVIKPLGKIFSNLQGISGATILGTGEVALILDVPRLIGSAVQLRKEEQAAKKG